MGYHGRIFTVRSPLFRSVCPPCSLKVPRVQSLPKGTMRDFSHGSPFFAQTAHLFTRSGDLHEQGENSHCEPPSLAILKVGITMRGRGSLPFCFNGSIGYCYLKEQLNGYLGTILFVTLKHPSFCLFNMLGIFFSQFKLKYHRDYRQH